MLKEAGGLDPVPRAITLIIPIWIGSSPGRRSLRLRLNPTKETCPLKNELKVGNLRTDEQKWGRQFV